MVDLIYKHINRLMIHHQIALLEILSVLLLSLA